MQSSYLLGQLETAPRRKDQQQQNNKEENENPNYPPCSCPFSSFSASSSTGTNTSTTTHFGSSFCSSPSLDDSTTIFVLDNTDEKNNGKS